MNHKIRPSSLSFLYNGCPRCFYLDVVHNIRQPSIPLPSIFTKIADLLKYEYEDTRTEEFNIDLPPGTVRYGEEYIRSEPIHLPGHINTCFISGRFDTVVEFDDGSYGVIDYKTGKPKEDNKELYGRQLHAYSYALRHPGRNSMELTPITKLGLIYFYPEDTARGDNGNLSYVASPHWIEIEQDEDNFLEFLDGVMTILESPTPPEPEPDCDWCNYRARLSRMSDFQESPQEDSDLPF